MTELDIALAATYLKRVTLSSSALDELIEEENTRKIRRVVSSNGLMQSSPRSGLLADDAPRKKPDDGELRRGTGLVGLDNTKQWSVQRLYRW